MYSNSMYSMYIQYDLQYRREISPPKPCLYKSRGTLRTSHRWGIQVKGSEEDTAYTGAPGAVSAVLQSQRSRVYVPCQDKPPLEHLLNLEVIVL